MDTFEVFRQQLQAALAHLHDPDPLFAEDFCVALLGVARPAACSVQSAILRAIGDLTPGPDAPPGSAGRLAHAVLHQRFVLRLSQEEAATRLDLSVRSLQRIQREATHGLARFLWERGRPAAGNTPAAIAAPPDGWLSQVRQELLLLQQSAPAAECGLEEVIGSALRIAAAAHAHTNWTPTGAAACVRFHPTALRHVFVNLIATLTELTPTGTIEVALATTDEAAQVSFSSRPAPPAPCPDLSLAAELLAAQYGLLAMRQTGDALTITVTLPLAQPQPPRATVLVVDDNADLVALYHTYCAKTRFDLVHLGEATHLFETVAQTRPAIILLDILLPHLDGWDVLFELHVNPLTQQIPVIVCSVVTDEKLVLDLGARLYLRKPVWRQQLLDAFESVLH